MEVSYDLDTGKTARPHTRMKREGRDFQFESADYREKVKIL